MSHADTIRASERSLDKIGEGDWTPQDQAHAKLTETASELYAENQRLRDALKAITEVASVSYTGDSWYCDNEGVDASAAFALVQAALDGTPSEDAWHCPDCGWKGAEPEELDVFDSDGMERIAYLCPNCGGTDLNRTPSAAQTLEDAK